VRRGRKSERASVRLPAVCAVVTAEVDVDIAAYFGGRPPGTTRKVYLDELPRIALTAERLPVRVHPCRAVTRRVTRQGYMVDLSEGSSRRSRPCHLSMCA
jgi:hypothetical protein